MEGGEKIQPDDIEERIAKEQPAIAEIALLQKSHKLVALVVPEKGHSKEQVGQAIKAGMQGRASYLQVTDFAITEQGLPKTNLGKLKRHELEKAYDEAQKASKGQGIAKSKDSINAEDQALLADDVAHKTYEWFKVRYAGQDVTLDTSPQSDLGVDSLDWLNITLEMNEKVGVELSQDAIGRIETVRDLLKEATQAGDSGLDDRGSPVEHPELYLSAEEMEYVKIQTGKRARYRRQLYDLVCFLMSPFKVKAIGLENIPKESCVFTPNHASYLDSFAIGCIMPYERLIHTQWAGWTGLAYANPLASYLSRLSGIIPIEGSKSLVTSLALGALVIQKGHSLFWYPEGTRTEDGKLLPFKQGLGLILEKNAVPVVPVYIDGAREALPPGAYIPTFSQIRIYFGEAVMPSQLIKEGTGKTDAEKLVTALRERVLKMEVEAKQKSIGKV
jgi:long-chain acyl-CoA synthetase